MRWYKLIETVFTIGVVVLWGSSVHADDFSADLSGFEEIGPLGAGETGAILSGATGTLRLHLDKKSNSITYTLSYTSGLSAPVTQAHIHFGKVHVAGGIIAFLCSNLPNPPLGTPPCPTPSGTVSGVLHANSVIGPTLQNVAAGNFDALVAALTSDTAYGNVHTTTFPAGEIRGQIQGNKSGDNRSMNGD
jgi:CHRD domain-containing protein